MPTRKDYSCAGVYDRVQERFVALDGCYSRKNEGADVQWTKKNGDTAQNVGLGISPGAHCSEKETMAELGEVVWRPGIAKEVQRRAAASHLCKANPQKRHHW